MRVGRTNRFDLATSVLDFLRVSVGGILVGLVLGTVGLDPIQIREVRDLVRSLGGRHTVLLSSHLLPEVRTAAEVFKRGDEFVLLLPDLPYADVARNVAERIVHCFQKPFDIEGARVAITASLGVAIFPGDGEDADAAQRAVVRVVPALDERQHADVAVLVARRRGRWVLRTPDSWALAASALLLVVGALVSALAGSSPRAAAVATSSRWRWHGRPRRDRRRARRPIEPGRR